MRVYSVRPPPPASRPRWAALLCLQLGDVAVLSLCAQYFLNVRGVGGITTLGALCVFSKRWTTACQSGSFVVFCGRTAIIDSSGVKFDPTHNLENFKIILIFLITCGMVVLLEIKPLHRRVNCKSNFQFARLTSVFPKVS